MSKIICDVCGTSYPETATQCPICGCVRPVDVVTVNNDVSTDELQSRGSYTYVKGGRFSKKNVRKRMRDENTEHVPMSVTAQEFDDEDEPVVNEKSTKGLTIAVLALLAAIVALTIYLVVRFFAPNLGAAQKPPVTTVPYTAAPTTTVPTTATIPCTGLDLDDTDVLLTFVGDSWRIDAVALPSDTTDMIQFFSSNESVATVSASGEIRAVGEGSAVITVVCGDVSKECFVNCTVETVPPETTEPVVTEPVTEPTEPVTEPTTEPTEPQQTVTGPCKISHKDVTIKVGASFNLKLKDAYGNVVEVTWVAKNPNKVTISGNKITGAASGTTEVSCTVNGKTYTCIVRVNK
jgi:hypothetical protein